MPQIRSLSINGHELRLLRYGRVDSTQRIARGLPVGTVVIADSQTAGHGRYGREWVSPPGGLYTSIVLAPDPLLPLRAGVAVAEALSECGIPAQLKWPNDVTVDGKKIAGVLIEEADGTMILGIGVNLDRVPYPGATSVRAAGGRVPAPEELLSRILRVLLAPMADDAILTRYRALCATLGKEVSVSIGRGLIRGRAVGIEPDGALIVSTAAGARRIASGECRHLYGRDTRSS